MEFQLPLVLLLAVVQRQVGGFSQSPECRDKVTMCQILTSTVPNFCQLEQHSAYAMENCQKSCDFCQVKPSMFNHTTNLIWAQTPQMPLKAYTVSRLVAIQGDPNSWINNRKPQVTYISAPHFTWEFKALGFHFDEQTLFWSESMNKKIQSLVLNGSTDTRTLFSGTSPEVYGIAVDWLSRNLYFTDALYNWIIMTSSNPSGQQAYKILVQENLDAPHGLAVYPQKGLLFWSDWGERPRIEFSDLLGQDRRTLVETNMKKPSGLTIDFSGGLLYWVDPLKATVEVVQLNGQGRKVIHQEEGTSFYGVALYNDFIFVTERNRGMLKVFNHVQSLVSFTLGNIPYDITMYDGSRQPGNSSECEDLGCEQLCVLDPVKGPQCLCGEGYVPEDAKNISCKASTKFVHPSHIYAIRDSICQYPANIADMSLSNVSLTSQCFLEEKQGYITLTFDARENRLYYFANNTKTINRLPLELGGKSSVVTGGTGTVRGMALDWVAGNLYWTDSDNGYIKVARKSGAYQMVVVDNITNPMGIAVHPGRGQIFWTAHGRSQDIAPSVEKANMDGSGRAVIMSDNLKEPNHICIDFETDVVFWADSGHNHVRQLDLNTGRVQVFFEQTMVKFYGLSVFKDFLLWTDTDDLNGIHVARIDKMEKVRGIIHPRNGVAADLITFDIQNQPNFNNTCMEGTSTCSHLCLMSQANSSTCYCGIGYELSLDGFTCVTNPVMDNFLLVNDAYQRQIFQVNLVNAVVEAVNLEPTHDPIALAYDPYEVKVFWSDNRVNMIREATIDGKYMRTVMLLNNGSMCDGLAADYINKLLFFTDTGFDVIGVVSLRDYRLFSYIITTDLDQPRDIVVHPNQGLIYWSDWGVKPKIEMASMDGSGRENLVTFQTAAWPNGLALDLQGNQLFWVDARADQISVINLATKKVTVLIEESGAHYFSMDVVGDYLYVTDWTKNYLRRMNKNGGPLTQFGPTRFTRLYGIKGFNSTESFKGISVCVYSHCGHLCLPKQGNQYSCRCTEGYITEGAECRLNSTGSTVVLPPSTVDTSTAPSTSPSSTTTQTSDTTSQPSEQSTSLPTSTISSSVIPTTMALSSVDMNSTSESWEINTTVEPSSNGTTEIPSVDSSTYQSRPSTDTGKDGANATVLMFSASDPAGGLSGAMIGLIVACIVLIIMVAIAAGVWYQRRYKYVFSHGKLIEEKNPADFYKIAFPGPGEDSVTFDTGIENPTYDCLHHTTHLTTDGQDGSMT